MSLEQGGHEPALQQQQHAAKRLVEVVLEGGIYHNVGHVSDRVSARELVGCAFITILFCVYHNFVLRLS